MIPGTGVYRVRRRRFAEARPGDAAKEGSTMGGSGNGGSINRLVSVSILSSSSFKPSELLETGVEHTREFIETVSAGRARIEGNL